LDSETLTCGVLVIGAGPAGSTAARFAAQRNVAVILLERRESVGIPVRCAEYVPLPVSRYLTISSPSLLSQPVKGMMTFLPGEPGHESPGIGAMINRDRFDQELVRLAIKAGAHLEKGFQAVQWSEGRVTALGSRQMLMITPRVIIGADGPSSVVAKWMGVPPARCLVAAQYQVPLQIPLDHTRVYFRPYITGGYGWLFPKGRVANLGLGIDPTLDKGLRKKLDQFKKELVEEGAVGDRVLRLGGGLIPVGGLRKSWRGNMILAGDAAGTCHPITGAGVGNALLSGEMAGEAAAEAILTRSLAPLQEYEQGLYQLLGPSLNRAVKKRKALIGDWHKTDFPETIKKNWVAFKDYYR
jgi:digeranylgeranylglycerophospholipid reductase